MKPYIVRIKSIIEIPVEAYSENEAELKASDMMRRDESTREAFLELAEIDDCEVIERDEMGEAHAEQEWEL